LGLDTQDDAHGDGLVISAKESAMEKLEHMGFTRSPLTQQLLAKHQNNIEATVTELLQTQGGEGGGRAAGARDDVGAGGGAGGDTVVNECVVCMDSKKSHVLVPCGHVCVCKVCAGNIVATKQACPVCRARVEQVIKVYL